MEFIKSLIDYIVHVEAHLDFIIRTYPSWIYIILFSIIFIETGFIVMPFLPGDSLLFAIGAFCARGSIDISFVVPLLIFAAFLGDIINYSVGKKIGNKIFSKEDSIWFSKKNLDKAHSFYEKYGAKTVIFARFIPIVRTFSPFVAGVGEMTFKKFISYSLLGGFLWVCSFICLGYFFGNLPMVQKNFKFVILAIIIVSVLPAIIEVLRKKRPLVK